MADYPTSSDGRDAIACRTGTSDAKSAGRAADRRKENSGLLKRAIQGTVTAEMIRRASSASPEDFSQDNQSLDLFWSAIVQRLGASLLSHEDMNLGVAVKDIVAADRPFLEVYGHVLMPLCGCLRGKWARDEATFLDVTLASGRIALIFNSVSQAYAELARADDGHDTVTGGNVTEARLLLARMPGDNHALGLQIVETVFVHAGWHVRRGGEDGDLGSCYSELADAHFDLFGLSVGVSSVATEVAAAIGRARSISCNPSLKVCLGGAAVIATPEPFLDLGADFLATDALQGVALANEAVGVAF